MSGRFGETEELRELRQQTRWLRFMALQTLPAILADVLRDARERRAYELSDGSRTTRQVASLTASSPATISRWWSKWRALGLASHDATGRVTHLVSLEEVGMIPAQKAEEPGED